MIDILFVTYNSSKWIDACVDSIASSDYDLRNVSLYFWDNKSSDDTIQKLTQAKEKYAASFADFYIQSSDQNLGFGRGNNAAAKLGKGDIIFCLNIDTTLYPDTLRVAMDEIEKSDDKVGLWELRQFPYEHPKVYEPLTHETAWSSGACFMMRRTLFEKLGGFDEAIFMYGEDVDLSWRVRTAGYTLKYIPKAVVNHYCYQSAGEIKPTQYTYSLVNNLLLRCKFGGKREIIWWHLRFAKLMLHHGPFVHARSIIAKAYLASIPQYIKARKWNKAHRKEIQKTPLRFVGYDYEDIRDGAFHENRRPVPDKKVSIIVRTCGRPAVLRETLLSLREQTYPNIEIVIAEDGPEVSRKIIEAEFSDLNIKYVATGEKRGRCVAGNLAMSIASGDYFNFLDDDDLFYADHVETLVAALEKEPRYRIAYSLAFDTPLTVKSKDPYSYVVHGYRRSVKYKFDLKELLYHNLFPIQAVMFSREVYEQLGGLNEEMDVLEDWNLWVRYATRYAYLYVEKTTSIYRTPADRTVNAGRQKELDDALHAARELHDHYVFRVEGRDLHQGNW